MKKLIAILLCALMLAAAVACANKPEPSPAPVDETPAEHSDVTAPEQSAEPEAETEPEAAEEPAAEPTPAEAAEPETEPEGETEPEDDTKYQLEPLAGGWQLAENAALTDEQKAIFEKALETLVGVDYVPVALLGTQVVAGTNYCFLAKATVVSPDAQPKLVLVYVYEDLSGNAEVLNVADMPVIPNEYGTAEPIDAEEMLSGGWAYAEDPAITDEIRTSLEKALDELVGADYEPVANLGTQVVAGLNRCILCKVTPVVPNAVSHLALVYVYEALDGTAEIISVLDFDFGALCTYGA